MICVARTMMGGGQYFASDSLMDRNPISANSSD